MKKRILLGLALILPFAILGQSYHRLAARDFAGIPPADNGDIAYTNCYVGYSYDATRHNGNYQVTFNVQLILNNSQSYIRFEQIKSRDNLLQILRHEQGHYNIAYLLKCEAYTVLTHHNYSGNYQNEIVALFKQVQEKYHRLNTQYENETEHMLNVKNQDKWNAWFSAQLNGLSI